MEAAPESQLPGPMAKTRVLLHAALPFAAALAAGAVLRLWMLKELFGVAGDSLLYGGMAKNLLLHGRYAITGGSGVLHETLIRLPGYPLFLAACFGLFGIDNYVAVAYVQIGLELLGCLFLAGFVRPRVENLPIDNDWWVFAHHNEETIFSWAYAGLNAVYLLLALVGLCLRPRYWPWMLLYMVLRSGLLMTIEAPETRYTLECFPMLFVLAGIGGYRVMCWVLLSVLKVKASPGKD